MTALLGLTTRLAMAKVLVFTDLAGLSAVCESGADIVVLADRSVPADEQVAALVDQRRGLRGSRVILGAADAAVAEAGMADLVHGGGSRPHQWALRGVSCHTAEQVQAALADSDVDYFSVGPAMGGGQSLVRETARQAPPGSIGAKAWFAAGGITPSAMGEVVAMGALRVAVSGCVRTSADPGGVVSALRRPLSAAWRELDLPLG